MSVEQEKADSILGQQGHDKINDAAALVPKSYSFLGQSLLPTANLTIKEAKTAKQQLEEKPRNSPDHTKRRTVKIGETLALIAYEEYDDAGEWRRIADANGIVDPKDVSPGTVLTLPPIL